MVSMVNTFKHFKTICVHRKWVRYYGKLIGLPWWQCFKHDLSKFSPTEFFESVRYYQGTSSPIDACKKANGYSMAWFHHKGRNKHHYEYWGDNFDHGVVPVLMPKKYFLELVADYLAAGQAYMKDDFSYESELEWWKNKRSNRIAMNPGNIAMLDRIFYMLAELEKQTKYPTWANISALTPEQYLKTIGSVYDSYVERGVNFV